MPIVIHSILHISAFSLWVLFVVCRTKSHNFLIDIFRVLLCVFEREIVLGFLANANKCQQPSLVIYTQSERSECDERNTHTMSICWVSSRVCEWLKATKMDRRYNERCVVLHNSMVENWWWRIFWSEWGFNATPSSLHRTRWAQFAFVKDITYL